MEFDLRKNFAWHVDHVVNSGSTTVAGVSVVILVEAITSGPWFITMSVQLCVPHDGQDGTSRAGLPILAIISQISMFIRYSPDTQTHTEPIALPAPLECSLRKVVPTGD